MKTVTVQLNARVTPHLNTVFARLANMETDGNKAGLLKLLIRRAASDLVQEAVKEGVLPEGTGSEPFLTGQRFDTALAKALEVLESKMAEAGDENG